MTRTGQMIAAAAVIAITILGLGRPTSVSAQGSKRPADVKHGAAIAAQGTAAVPACRQCHDGGALADGGGGFPRLAGQSGLYLENQMHDFASSQRASPIMSPIARPLSADDIADVAAYYASSNDPFPPLAGPDTALVRDGAQLARVGMAAKDIQACNNCHGPDGAGIPPAIPYLAGQYAQYIAFQLHAWRRGFRKNSPDSMTVVAKGLDDRDIEAVAAFYQQARSAAAGASASK
jgi:cytochrome c553